MYEFIDWSSDLDLTEFYTKAAEKGYVNNVSQQVMVDCFQNETNFKVWILYKDGSPVGSVAAHTFPEMGENAYRILARTCVLEGTISDGLGTANTYIVQHQNTADQFFIPKSIEWCQSQNPNAVMYATSNDSVASTRQVEEIYFPTLAEQGEWENTGTITYRGWEQQVWKLNTDVFLEHLDLYDRWELS